MTNPDLSRAAWRRSKYSGSNGNCVEIAATGPRSWCGTPDRDRGTLAFDALTWAGFVATLK